MKADRWGQKTSMTRHRLVVDIIDAGQHDPRSQCHRLRHILRRIVSAVSCSCSALRNTSSAFDLSLIAASSCPWHTPARSRHLHAAELRAPRVERFVTEPVLSCTAL